MIKHSGFKALSLAVNGEERQVVIKPNETLLRVLRERVGLMGAKIGCENGDCGACTVLLEGLPVKACLVLAVEVGDRKITTIEGLNDTEIQEAFMTHSGFQCGFCTSGFLINSYALLEAKPDADENEKKDWLSANLCRCTGYEGIKLAVDAAQEKVLKRKSEISTLGR